MGYSTDFNGTLKLSRQATPEERDYINLISYTRRMKRDVNKLMKLYQGKYGNPFAIDNTPESIYGEFGEYFAMNDDDFGQGRDSSIIDYNCAPGESHYGDPKSTKIGQPGLWCQWIIHEDGFELEWNGAEKFYNYIEWLKYLIDHFFEPWGIKLNGEIEWQGEDMSDRGKIGVIDNVVKTYKVEYVEESDLEDYEDDEDDW
jgi:hypothetical protein